MNNPLNNYVGLGLETTYGTPVSPSIYLPINESDGVQIDNDIQYVESIQAGVLAKNKGSFKGKVNYQGGFEMNLLPDVGLILKSAIGDVSSSLVSGETSVYQHTFTESVNKPSLTVEQKIGEIIKRFGGYILSNFSLEGKAGDIITLTFEGIAKNQASVSETTPTYSLKRPFNFADIYSFKVGTTDYKSFIDEFKIEYNNNIESYYSLGSNEVQSIYPKPSEINGSFTLFLTDANKNLFEDYIAKTPNSVEIEIRGDSIGTSSYDTFKIKIYKATFTSAGVKLGTDYNAIDVEFDGEFSYSDNKMFDVVLINEISSY